MARTGPSFKRYIESIAITNAGSGYDSSDPPTLFIQAPTLTTNEGDKVQAAASITISSNIVDTLTITEPGDGYLLLPLPQVYLRGKLTGVTVTSATENGADSTRTAGTYNVVPQDTSSGAGLGAQFTIVVGSGGSISSATITNNGSNKFYAENDLIYIANAQIGGNGTGNQAILQVSTIASGSGAVFTPVVNLVNRPQKYFHRGHSYLTKFTIPDFIRNDYPLFATFIEKYFDFLDTDDTTITALGGSSGGPQYLLAELIDSLNIDFKEDDFLTILLQQYAIDFPQDAKMDTRFLIKRIREFYESKGSRRGIQTFFRTVFDEDVEIVRPSDFVLKPSDGFYSKEVAVKLYQNAEITPIPDPFILRGRKVDIVYYESTASITARKRLNTSISRIKKIAYTNPTAYEATIGLPADTVIPGPGVEANLVAVIGGKIATVGTIGAADAARAAGNYTIGASDYTAGGNGTGATFSVVVNGAGAATITVTAVGDNYAPDETITIADNKLGSGGGAALTFKVATITEGKIFSITIVNGGQGFSANAAVNVTPNSADTITTTALIDTRVSNGAITNTVFVNNTKGVGYNNVPILTVDTDPVRTWIGFEGATDLITAKTAFLTRVLNNITLKTNTGTADGGFKVGQAYPVQETGDILGVYAIDYFSEDYTLTGIENDAFVIIRTVDSNNYPTAIDIINTGVGFQRASFDFVLRSPNNETATITCNTGFAHTFAGRFKDSKGFLSNVNRLQDNAVYQNFSYQIRTSLPKSEWGEALKRSGHPAGMVNFADLQINQVLDFSSNINIVPDIFVFRLFAEIDVAEMSELVAKDVHKPTITDTFAFQDNDILEPGLVKTDSYGIEDDNQQLDVSLVKTEGPDMQDEPALDVHKPTIADTFAFQDVAVLLLVIQRNITESVDWAETVVKAMEIIEADSAGIDDDNQQLDVNIVKTEGPDMQDEPALDVHKPTITDSTGVEDDNQQLDVEQTSSDTYGMGDAGVVFIQNYVSSDYFAEDYVGTNTSFS